MAINLYDHYDGDNHDNYDSYDGDNPHLSNTLSVDKLLVCVVGDLVVDRSQPGYFDQG